MWRTAEGETTDLELGPRRRPIVARAGGGGVELLRSRSFVYVGLAIGARLGYDMRPVISRFLVALLFLLAVVVSTSAAAQPEEMGPESTWSEGIEAELAVAEALGSRHESLCEARDPGSLDLGQAPERSLRGRFADEPASPPPRR